MPEHNEADVHAVSNCWACLLAGQLPWIASAYRAQSADDLNLLEFRMHQLLDALMASGRPPRSFREPVHHIAALLSQLIHQHPASIAFPPGAALPYGAALRSA